MRAVRRIVERYRARRSGCHPACWNARGPDCECLCSGKYHGRGFGPVATDPREASRALVKFRKEHA
jgi:hypothetical protein